MKTQLLTVFVCLCFFCKAQTQFGALVNFPDTLNTTGNIIDVTNQLGTKYLRQTLVMQGWDGTATRFNQFTVGGFKVILNRNAAIFPSHLL